MARRTGCSANRAVTSASGNDIAAAVARRERLSRFSISSLRRGVRFGRRSKDPGHLFGWGGDHFHYIAHLHQLKQLLHVRFAHTDAAVRNVVADGILIVGAVYAVAFAAESHPARA